MKKLRQTKKQRKHDTFIHYSGHDPPACVRCGSKKDLTIDHIRGDGAKMRREISGHKNIYNSLRKLGYPTGFQTLCRKCNQLKKQDPKGWFLGTLELTSHPRLIKAIFPVQAFHGGVIKRPFGYWKKTKGEK